MRYSFLMSKNNFNANEEEVDISNFLEILKRRWKTLSLITLSSILYFPIIKSKNEKNKIIRVQTSMESILPKIEFAIPAVTIVTAVWIVNIVPRVIMKKIIGIIGCNFL